MLALILMWIAFSYFGIDDHRAVLARVRRRRRGAWAGSSICSSTSGCPAIVLGVAGTARLTRIMRANLLDELNKPYVVTARAKGMSEWTLVLKYPVRLAFNPLISTIGWYLPQLFSGSLIVATVMNLPNIGPLLLRALIQQDMYLAGSILLIYCFLTIVGTLISDILLALFDPRIRMEGDVAHGGRDLQDDERTAAGAVLEGRKSASPSPPTGSWCGGASARTAWRSPARSSCSSSTPSSWCRTSSAPRTPKRPTPRSPSSRPADLLLRQHGLRPVGAGRRRQAQSGHAADGVGDATRRSESRSRFFVRGYKYKVLGLFETDIHLIGASGPEVQGTAATSWAPTGWGATSGRA